ncbi:MAG TPA: GntR family transcriptional regulator [Ktedonobacteraceae bacterium]
MSIYTDQTYQKLRQLVEKQAGQKLPGERELANQLGIPRAALRGLLDALEMEGLVRRQQGSGTYAMDTQVQQLRTVVLLIDDELKLGEDPFFSLLVEHLQLCLQEQNISCMIERINQHWQPQQLRDGAITLGQAGKTVLARLQKDTPPVVSLLLDAKLPARVSASIFQLADHEAGSEAAQRLLTLHCQRVLFIGRRDLAASRERLFGIEEVLSEANILLQFVPCAQNYTAGLRLGQGLPLPQEEGPIGIIAANDWLAVGLRAGLSSRSSANLPTLHLISFDGLSITADTFLHIEALVAPLQTIASDAVAELHRLPTSASGRVVRYPFHWRV